MKDYFSILEISPRASQHEILEQYRFLLQAWHPDKFPTPSQKVKAEERVKDINEAYAILSDPYKRSEYERQLSSTSYSSASISNSQAYQAQADRPANAGEVRQPKTRQRRASDEQLGIGCIYIFISVAFILEFVAVSLFRIYNPAMILIILILAGLITIPLTFKLDDFLKERNKGS